MVEMLLGANANINLAKSSGATPLYAAAQRNHSAVVRILVRAGADLDKGTTSGSVTPLQTASQKGHLVTRSHH